MLTPEYLAGLPEPILRLWDDAEREILRDMARRISTYDYWIPAADYQAERLIAAGHTRDEILAVLAKTTRKTEKELRQMMMEAGSRCLREDVAVYQAAGLKTPLIRESKALTEILNSGYRHTLGTMQNITRTTARTATRQFEDALDLAWSQVSSGAFDAGSAIRQAVKQLCQQGVEAVEYPSGHKDTIETAVRRAVLTGVNQTAAKLQEQLADEVGCDLVEVSAHAGARPEHAEWQGKIYSRSGKSEKYPDFRSSTGYGTGAGLCGWNCRHTFGPYIEGSPRVWTDEKLAELNAPKYEYQGEKFTEYEARQKEKYFDRQITRWQREAEAMKAAGQDPAEAQAKVKAWERRKSDFVLNRSKIQTETISNNVDIPVKYSASKPKTPFEEITGRWYPDATPGSHEVKDLLEYTAPDGTTYKVDGHHVKLKYSRHEKEIAELLEREVGGEIYMVPKVDNPQNVRTPDYLFHGKGYDLKTIAPQAGQNTLYNRTKKTSGQTKNVILDITKSGLTDETVKEQINKIFWSKETQFIDEIVIVNGESIVGVYKRKKRG